jgi:hypothetical protein
LLPALIDRGNPLGINLRCAPNNGCDLHGVMTPWRLNFLFYRPYPLSTKVFSSQLKKTSDTENSYRFKSKD